MDKNKIDHLLVIRLSALGDVAMTVPVISAFTRQFPEIHISVLTRPFFKPIFNGLDNVAVIEADVKEKHKGMRGLWRLYSDLSKQDFNVIADLHNVLRTNILKSYFSLNKIPFIQIDKGRSEKKALTRAGNKVFQPLKPTVERYADVFRSIGFDLNLSLAANQARLPIPARITEPFGKDARKWIGIAPFAAFKGKMYPLKLMEEVISQIDQSENYHILLFGGGSKEESLLASIAKKYRWAHNMAGTYSFEEELALISNLDVMVSMDSGNAHLAAMYGIPTITIWGVTHPHAGFYPFGQDPENALLADREQFPMIPTSVYGNKQPKGYEAAISTITPQQILQKIYKVLNV